MERLFCPAGLSGVCIQDMEVKDMGKMLAGLRAYFGTLPMLGMSIDPADTVPEHVGVIHAFTQHQEKRAGCQAPGRGGKQKGWVCLTGVPHQEATAVGHWDTSPASTGLEMAT